MRVYLYYSLFLRQTLYLFFVCIKKFLIHFKAPEVYWYPSQEGVSTPSLVMNHWNKKWVIKQNLKNGRIISSMHDSPYFEKKWWWGRWGPSASMKTSEEIDFSAIPFFPQQLSLPTPQYKKSSTSYTSAITFIIIIEEKCHLKEHEIIFFKPP